MPYNIILNFRLLMFMSLIVLYFLHSTSVLSFYIDAVLTLSICVYSPVKIITIIAQPLVVSWWGWEWEKRTMLFIVLRYDQAFNCICSFQYMDPWRISKESYHSFSMKLRVVSMMTSSNGNFFRVPGHLCGEFIGHRWIPCTKTSDAELWCFPRSASE